MEDEVKKIKNKIKTEEKEDIEKYINNLLEKHPTSNEIKYWKAYIDLTLNNNLKTQETVLELLESDENNKTYLNFIANTYLLKEDYEKSLEYYKRTLNQYNNKFKKEEDCIFALTGSMEAYTLLKDKKNSNKTQPKLLKLFNNDKTSLLEYANKLKNNKNYMEALKTYNFLLYKDKKNVMVNLSKADLYEKTKDTELAIQTYNLVLQERKDNIGALNKQGKCLIDNKEIEKGEENFKKVLNINSKNTEALYGLGYSKMKQGKRNEALEYYNKTLEENPYHKQALLGKVKILKKDKNYEEILKIYDTLLENDKLNQEALYGKIETYHKLKDYASEIKFINILLKRDKNNTKLLNLKINALYDDENYEEALKICNKTLEIEENKETLKKKKQIENKLNNTSLLSSIKKKLGF